jgi:hypothetical protein
MKLNEDKSQRTMGWIFMIIWISVAVFYMLWDGWVYEWRDCVYTGLNQHFDFNLNDMQYSIVDGEVVYESTSNLHNIIYLCFINLLIGWIGLLFDSEWAKQGSMATLAFPVIALLSTLNPITDHLYPLQIVYNFVHISGITIGVYLYYKQDMDLKKTMPMMLFTWIIYVLTRIIMTPWPYWENDGLAFFGANQINDMPLYFYGLEYIIVILIFLVVNFSIIKVNEKIPNRKGKALLPFIFFVTICILFLVTGLITLQDINMGSCP